MKRFLRRDYLYLQENTKWPIQTNIFLSLLARTLMATVAIMAFLGTPYIFYVTFQFGMEHFNALFAVVALASYVKFYSYTKKAPRTWQSIKNDIIEFIVELVRWIREFAFILANFFRAALSPSRMGGIRQRAIDYCRETGTLPDAAYAVALSDLHVTASNRTAEGRVAVNRELRKFLRGNLGEFAGARAVIICGDTTDTGHPMEWTKVCTAFRAFQRKVPRESGLPILVAPGNHDVNITHGGPFSSEDFWLHARNMRLLRFLLAASSLNPGLGTPKGPLKYVLKKYESEIRRYLRSPFQTRNDARTFNPETLWNSLYPMFQTIEGELYVVMDSNRNSSNIITNAIGEIRNDQIVRLRQIIRLNGSKRVHVILHHHVIGVGRICPSYPKMEWGGLGKPFAHLLYLPVNVIRYLLDTAYALALQPHFMRITNSNQFLRFLDSICEQSVIYHGHRHIGKYLSVAVSESGRKSEERIRVVSVPSVSFGDESAKDSRMQYLRIDLAPGSPNAVTLRTA